LILRLRRKDVTAARQESNREAAKNAKIRY